MVEAIAYICAEEVEGYGGRPAPPPDRNSQEPAGTRRISVPGRLTRTDGAISGRGGRAEARGRGVGGAGEGRPQPQGLRRLTPLAQGHRPDPRPHSRAQRSGHTRAHPHSLLSGPSRPRVPGNRGAAGTPAPHLAQMRPLHAGCPPRGAEPAAITSRPGAARGVRAPRPAPASPPRPRVRPQRPRGLGLGGARASSIRLTTGSPPRHEKPMSVGTCVALRGGLAPPGLHGG